jgi:DNA repair protein RAD5
LLSFLELEPLNDKQFFRDYITLPIQRGNKNIGLSRLRLAMSQITLRRTKKVANINMVGKEYHLRRVDFVEGDHKNIHDVLYYTAQVTFDAVVREADYDEPEGTPLTAMFEMVLRVRQACCSGELIPKERYIRAAEIAADLQTRDGKISATEGFRLLNALQGIAVEVEDDDGEFLANDNEIENETDEEEEKNEQPGVESVLVGRPKRQAARDHFLYKRSKSNDEENLDSDTDSDDEVAIKDDSTDSEVSFGSFNEDDSDEELSSDVEPTPKKKPAKKRVKALTCNITQTAPKIDALLATIDEMKPEEKGVIFSQFTTFLNRVEKELWAKGHSFTRIDGSMNAASRIEAIKEFSKEDVTDSPRFILCSLRAAGTGINLTRGNVAFMLDPWWNQAVSAQAMDRVHRIGQTRKVRVYSFVMKDSIEERMVALTKAKAALGKGSMEKLSPKEECRAKLTAMKDLFEICDIDDCIDSDDDFDGPSFFDEQDKDESYHEESGDEPENFARDSLDSVSLDESSDNSTATPELSSDEEELVDDELSNDSDDDSWFHQNNSSFVIVLLSLQ